MDHKTILEKLTEIYKSPIDAGNVAKEYSRDLLEHALQQYENWKIRSKPKFESIAYFKKILQTGFYKHSQKGSEEKQDKQKDKEAHKRAIDINSRLHIILSDNEKIRTFLLSAISKLSEQDYDIMKARARNLLCYSQEAEIIESEFRQELKKSKNEEKVVEIFNKRFDLLNEQCILVLMRNSVLNGYFWEEFGFKSVKEVEFLKKL